MKKIKRLIRWTMTILMFFSALSVQQVYAAGWVDDWMQQSTTTGAGYFEGQQRGYYSGGSFSGRWHSSADFPVTVEAPRVKSGCGGIDVFMGGFSFLDGNYLVNKLQAILANAPAVAFDLGLKTLCEQCSNTIKNFEAMADHLNQMQLDECGTSKELVGVVMDEKGLRSSEEMKARLGTAIKENKLVSGVSDMWDKLGKADSANNNQVAAGDVMDITSGCNADIKNLFLAGTSMLQNVGAKMGIPANHIDLIRGLAGDLRLEGPANAYKVTYVSPCPENNPDSINSFISGEIYTKSLLGNCQQISDVDRDLVQHFHVILTNIATKLRNKNLAFNPDEQTFLDTTPLSALPILKTAVATKTEDSVIDGLADITAKGYSLKMFSDLYQRAEMISLKGREVLEKGGATGGQGPHKCAAVVFEGNAAHNISIMMSKINELREDARSNYLASAQEMTAIMNIMEHMQNTEIQMNAELTRRYGRDVVARLNL